MTMSQTQMLRPWRQIAEELAHEHDSRRISELSEELTAALDVQGYEQMNLGVFNRKLLPRGPLNATSGANDPSA